FAFNLCPQGLLVNFLYFDIIRIYNLDRIKEVRELREFWVTYRLEIPELHSRAEYAESHFEQSHNRQIGVRSRTRRTDMTEQDIEASRAMAEAAEQRAATLQVSLRAARMDVGDLTESREADRFEMAELRSQAQDIETSLWDLERHLGLYTDILASFVASFGLDFAEIEQIVAHRVADAIETIAIYEAKTRVARDLMNRVEQQKDKVAKNANNRRKWEGDHDRSSCQQQNKEHKVIRAHTAEPGKKKGYVGNLPLCNKCKFHHTSPYAAKCGNLQIRYHPGKETVIAGALSRKERIKPLRVRALVMTIGLNLRIQILNAHAEEMKEENVKEENLHGMNKDF
ncbi:hypothetical protein Tco_1122809, partial [Tanacetum coccineum]